MRTATLAINFQHVSALGNGAHSTAEEEGGKKPTVSCGGQFS